MWGQAFPFVRGARGSESATVGREDAGQALDLRFRVLPEAIRLVELQARGYRFRAIELVGAIWGHTLESLTWDVNTRA
jgi:hypothetical protein